MLGKTVDAYVVEAARVASQLLANIIVGSEELGRIRGFSSCSRQIQSRAAPSGKNIKIWTNYWNKCLNSVWDSA